jgi:hypothetical protein
MGQAKRRGTFDQRKAKSIELQKFIIDEMNKQEAKWYQSLSDEEKTTVDRNRAKQALILDKGGYKHLSKNLINSIKRNHHESLTSKA